MGCHYDKCLMFILTFVGGNVSVRKWIWPKYAAYIYIFFSCPRRPKTYILVLQSLSHHVLCPENVIYDACPAATSTIRVEMPLPRILICSQMCIWQTWVTKWIFSHWTVAIFFFRNLMGSPYGNQLSALNMNTCMWHSESSPAPHQLPDISPASVNRPQLDKQLCTFLLFLFLAPSHSYTSILIWHQFLL